jgi:CheY-like chemotaxis protein
VASKKAEYNVVSFLENFEVARMTTKNALVVDDNTANRDFLERLLASAGFQVLSAINGQQALELSTPDTELKLAMIDMELPDINGIQLTYMLRERFPKAYIVVATVHDERSMIEAVYSRGGNCFLIKPHGFMELYKRLTTISLSELREGPYTVIDQFGPRTYTVAENR